MQRKNWIAPRMLLSLAAGLLSLQFAVDGLAQGSGKIVTCRVESEGKAQVNGPCKFTFEGSDGSFTLENRDSNKALFGSILIVTVSVISPGTAEVRGLTKDGINSRWGEAKRSSQDQACWAGSDFRICAR